MCDAIINWLTASSLWCNVRHREDVMQSCHIRTVFMHCGQRYRRGILTVHPVDFLSFLDDSRICHEMALRETTNAWDLGIRMVNTFMVVDYNLATPLNLVNQRAAFIVLRKQIAENLNADVGAVIIMRFTELCLMEATRMIYTLTRVPQNAMKVYCVDKL